MPISLDKWINTHVEDFDKIPLEDMTQYVFFRDPTRPIHQNEDYFLSPADGIIVYQQEVDHSHKLDIKGQHYTLKDIFEEKPDFEEALVCRGVYDLL